MLSSGKEKSFACCDYSGGVTARRPLISPDISREEGGVGVGLAAWDLM